MDLQQEDKNLGAEELIQGNVDNNQDINSNDEINDNENIYDSMNIGINDESQNDDEDAQNQNIDEEKNTDDNKEHIVPPKNRQYPPSLDKWGFKADEEKKQKEKGSQKTKDLRFILDIPLELSVELGRSKMLIDDLLQLGQGSIIELNKIAGEPLEIYVNKKLVARGEVVVVNEKFGIRLTDVISPIERVKSLALKEDGPKFDI